MDTDEILEEIGSFGLFQKRNSLFLGLIIFVLTFQTVSMVFIGAEPTWRCTANSSVCTRNGTISSDNDYYKARCNMSPDDWEFTTEFTSIVTEVGRFNTCLHAELMLAGRCQVDLKVTKDGWARYFESQTY